MKIFRSKTTWVNFEFFKTFETFSERLGFRLSFEKPNPQKSLYTTVPANEGLTVTTESLHPYRNAWNTFLSIDFFENKFELRCSDSWTIDGEVVNTVLEIIGHGSIMKRKVSRFLTAAHELTAISGVANKSSIKVFLTTFTLWINLWFLVALKFQKTLLILIPLQKNCLRHYKNLKLFPKIM